MFELTLLLLRAITMACRGHQDVVLENLALRHQLRTLQRRVKRPHLRTRDRMFWVLLATAWRRWRSALVLVQPETVVRRLRPARRVHINQVLRLYADGPFPLGIQLTRNENTGLALLQLTFSGYLVDL